MAYRQNHPNAQDREIVFHLTDSVTGLPKLGQVFAGTDLQLRKPGANAYANCNAGQQAAVVEIGAGDYVYTFAQAEFDTPGPGFAFKVNKAGALLWTDTDEIQRAFLGTAVAGTLLSTAFTTSRTDPTPNHWQNSLIVFLTGNLAGQVKQIGAYAVAGGLITLAGSLTFTGPPANGDIFELIDR